MSVQQTSHYSELDWIRENFVAKYEWCLTNLIEKRSTAVWIVVVLRVATA